MKSPFALLLVLMFAMFASVFSFDLAEANFVFPVDESRPVVKVQLPENRVYSTNVVPIAFTVEDIPYLYYRRGLFAFVLDGESEFFSPVLVSEGRAFCRYRATLSGLSEGTHGLNIVATGAISFEGRFVDASSSSGVVFFTVNVAVPRVMVDSPWQAKNYNINTLPLDFTVSEPVTSMSYSLDGEAIVPISGNTTLSGLSEGTHTIVVEAEDLAGSVGSSAPVKFTIATQTSGVQVGSESSPFPTLLVAVALIVSASAVSFGLVAYFLRRKRTSET